MLCKDQSYFLKPQSPSILVASGSEWFAPKPHIVCHPWSWGFASSYQFINEFVSKIIVLEDKKYIGISRGLSITI